MYELNPTGLIIVKVQLSPKLFGPPWKVKCNEKDSKIAMVQI